MDEMIFMVDDAPEGGFIARALGASILPRLTTWKVCGSKCGTRSVVTSTQVRVRKLLGCTLFGKKLLRHETPA